ncbi:hypothetical protein QTP88_018931 [Uroleucon formosanum]
MEKRSLKSLTVGDKIKIIEEVKKGVKRKIDIASEFGIPASTLSTILKNKDKILKAVEEAPCLPRRKRFKASSFPEIEHAMTEWIKRVEDYNLPISGPLIQEKAAEFAKNLGLTFQASSGWLEKFKLRNGIVEKIISGESAAVSEVDCEHYQTNILPSLLKEYDSKDIFNADEFGLFFKCTPDRTLTFKGDTCHGGKKSKERVTVMVGANMTGTEKLKLLVIGKSKQPRCFKKKNMQSLPVTYAYNKKAWMLSTIYESWIFDLDKRFFNDKRKVLLFVDNCSAHPKTLLHELKAILVVFLPPNMTSKLQPMDQGIIKNIKHHYRKSIMQKNLRKMDSGIEIDDINLLESIELLHKSWRAVTQSTIVNCYHKAGFTNGINKLEIEEVEPVEEETPIEWDRYQQLFPETNTVEFQHFVEVDSSVITTYYPTDNEILNDLKFQEMPNESSGEESVNEDDGKLALPKTTLAQALDSLQVKMNTRTSENVKVTNSIPPKERGRVSLKKQLGLLEGVAIILGIIFGSGIFISPSGVMNEAGSVGVSLTVWVMCGVLSMIGALCYAELGTSIPRSGGDYTYLFEGYGPLPAFLYLWDAMLVFVPTTNAIMGLTFANYVIKPFFSDCDNPDQAVRLLAAAMICFITFINCWNVKATTKIQNVFMFTKISALVLIIVCGGVYLHSNGFSKFANPWKGSVTDPGKLAVSVYSGIFSYSGWNFLNFMTEELKNPYVNLPRAIYISMPLVTIIYVLANVAYLAVLTPHDMVTTKAIAVTFGHLTMGSFEWLMPLMVALSAFGGLSVNIMTSSRMCWVGARYGHFPTFLSYINVERCTPTPALVFLNILSLLMLFTSDVNILITYSSIVEAFFTMLSVSSVLWNRWKSPNTNRPIKVSLWIPITYVIVSLFLIVLPCYVRPFQVGMGVGITLLGIPVYYVCVVWKTKPVWFQNFLKHVTFTIQKLFVVAKEEKADDVRE